MDGNEISNQLQCTLSYHKWSGIWDIAQTFIQFGTAQVKSFMRYIHTNFQMDWPQTFIFSASHIELLLSFFLSPNYISFHFFFSLIPSHCDPHMKHCLQMCLCVSPPIVLG